MQDWQADGGQGNFNGTAPHVYVATAAQHCYGCLKPLENPTPGHTTKASAMVVQCPDCRQLYCFECDVYIHEQLHNCPGCEGIPPTTALTEK